MIQKIEVENIKCGGCMNSIKTALLKMDDVSEVAIDKETDTVTVTGDANRDTIVAKLSKLGYPEKGHNSLLHKGISFVSCAVGNMTKTAE
ncbi:HMA domain-containing protein [Flavobacterium longum]|uniref:heavy-metal-associated domain-containing protein n=1 Tax=Flavobacterium longum TaxID=1299340 RepID=UPI0039E9AEAB